MRRALAAAMTAVAIAAAAATSIAPAAAQQDYPSRPIRIYHGFTSGGPVDIIARLVGQAIGERLGQQGVVEGKPGAGGTVGAAFVAKQPADGYSLFLMASGHSTSSGLYKSLAYDAVADFTMISVLASAPFAIVTATGSPFATIQDLVQNARAAPGRIDYGSGGVGSGMHLVAVLLQSRTGVRLNHIPYKGGNAPMLGLLSGEVPVLFNSVAGLGPQLESGKVRVLAVSTRKRYVALPNVPTLAETVAPDFDATAWYALAGPRGLPAAIVAKLNDVARAAVKRKDVAERLQSQGAEAWGTAPAEAQAFLASEVARWTKVIRDEKIAAPE